LGFAFSLAKAQTTVNGTILSGGVSRSYILYVPAVYTSSQPAPLVFNFHGYGSNNSQQNFYADFKPIADTANFILVLPQGLTSGGYAGWNNFGAVSSAAADINFVSDLIDTLSKRYNINSNRIYSTGFSNGGFMSYDLACFMSTRFAAIASVSGSMVASHLSACNPSHPMPVMEIHGTIDSTVSYTGVGGTIACTHIDSLVKHWVNFNNCNPTPVFTPVPNISTTDNCTAEHYVYSGSNVCTTVELFKVIGGDHTWPGASYLLPGKNTNEDFNACKEIWRFFSGCSLSTGINNIIRTPEVEVYPNPFSDNSTVRITNRTAVNYELNIFNVYGQEVQAPVDRVPEGFQIHRGNLNAGIYFLKIKSGLDEKTLKLIAE